MHWFSFVLGALVGWLVEWLIDIVYWRRRWRSHERRRERRGWRTQERDNVFGRRGPGGGGGPPGDKRCRRAHHRSRGTAACSVAEICGAARFPADARLPVLRTKSMRRSAHC